MKPAIFLMALMVSCAYASCTPSDEDGPTKIPHQPDTSNDRNGTGQPNESRKIDITIGSSQFTATLADNATTQVLMELLPLTLQMRDVNANEKCAELGQRLPVATYNPGTIRTGNLMLWGSNTLVLFYETFPTSYPYTRLGAIDNPGGLKSALGTGDVTVTFKAARN